MNLNLVLVVGVAAAVAFAFWQSSVAAGSFMLLLVIFVAELFRLGAKLYVDVKQATLRAMR